MEPIIEALRAGTPVVIPTDTVYGIAASAADPDAVAAIFAIKDRPVDTQIAALVADVAQAETLVDLGSMGHALAEAFWPGALTIVAPRRPDCVLAVGDAETIGVRCADHPLVRELAAVVGPIAATSANRHGEPTPIDAAAVARSLPDVELVVDGGELSGGASTVCSVVGGRLTVFREGPITRAQLDAALDASS